MRWIWRQTHTQQTVWIRSRRRLGGGRRRIISGDGSCNSSNSCTCPFHHLRWDQRISFFSSWQKFIHDPADVRGAQRPTPHCRSILSTIWNRSGRSSMPRYVMCLDGPCRRQRLFTRQPGDNGYPEFHVQPHPNDPVALELSPGESSHTRLSVPSHVIAHIPSLAYSPCFRLLVFRALQFLPYFVLAFPLYHQSLYCELQRHLQRLLIGNTKRAGSKVFWIVHRDILSRWIFAIENGRRSLLRHCSWIK